MSCFFPVLLWGQQLRPGQVPEDRVLKERGLAPHCDAPYFQQTQDFAERVSFTFEGKGRSVLRVFLNSRIPEPEHEAKIAEIVKASTLVDVDESGAKVRRNPEVPLDPDSEPRTIYLKGFSKTETQLDELLSKWRREDRVVD